MDEVREVMLSAGDAGNYIRRIPLTIPLLF
jgi:hypothetical protein